MSFMEGGGGLRNANLQKKPHPFRPSPPLTAIDRFLWGQNQNQNQLISNEKTLITDDKNKGTCPSGNALFCNFEASGCDENFGSYEESSFCDGVLVDGETLNWADHENNIPIPRAYMIEEAKMEKENSKGSKKRTKKGGDSIKNLIKGQWTDEEDRKLMKLVRQYGEKKWAQIAEKMVGRAGKQCRERWQNHLRPDIKKDNWNEEEERMLIEAHEELGNRWAEISRRIPGRTENSIKNHWNATKRRQNSRRKSKKQVGKKTLITSGKPQPTLLRDYIQSLNNHPTTTAATKNHTTTTTTSTATNSTISGDLTTDEFNFMESFFGDNSNESFVDNCKVVNQFETKSLSENSSFFDSVEVNSVLGEPNEDILKNHLPSDLYLSYLFHGVNDSLASGYSGDGNMEVDFPVTASFSGEKKEMDLIEMVSSFQFSRGSAYYNNGFMI